MIQLTGEQLKILELHPKNPVLIKGAAGSGKTTIAVARAQHLANSEPTIFGPNSVAIFTYTNALVTFVKSLLTEPSLNDVIRVDTFHGFAISLIEQLTGKRFVVVDDRKQRKRIEESINTICKTMNARITAKSVDFFVEEIQWIQSRMIYNVDDYISTPRIGRGTADKVEKEDKYVIWQVYETYKSGLPYGHIHYDDFSHILMQTIEETTNFQPPFTHIVIDEAQDLSPAQLIALSKLVKDEFYSISLVADAAQSIYRRGFSWSNIGLNIKRGRSVELKINYRNTREIALAATSLLKNEHDRSEFTEATLPNRKGDIPKMVVVSKDKKQIEYVLNLLMTIDLSTESCVLTHRTNFGVKEVYEFLQKRLSITIIDKQMKKIDVRKGLFITSMHAVKGLEFDHVIILDLTTTHLRKYVRNSIGDLDAILSSERKLLYTAMTRAKRTLTLLTKQGDEHPMLNEINPKTVDILSL